MDDRIIELRKSGLNTVEIGKIVGLSHKTVMKKLLKHGFQPYKNQSRTSAITHGIVFEDKNDIPNVAEQFLVLLCEIYGFDNCKPNNAKPYDYIIDFGDGWKKVQVKSSTNEDYYFSITKTRHTCKKYYEKSDFDYYFFFHKSYRCWLVPHSAVLTSSVVKVDYAFPKCELEISVGIQMVKETVCKTVTQSGEH